MEKIINQTPYNTFDLEKIASWECARIEETLYFADNGNFLLHCIGEDAAMKNSYGNQSFTNEDLFILEEEDVLGWMKVHAPDAFAELCEEINLELVA